MVGRLARTFSSTMRIEEEAEREEGGWTASGRRDEEGERRGGRGGEDADVHADVHAGRCASIR